MSFKKTKNGTRSKTPRTKALASNRFLNHNVDLAQPNEGNTATCKATIPSNAYNSKDIVSRDDYLEIGLAIIDLPSVRYVEDEQLTKTLPLAELLSSSPKTIKFIVTWGSMSGGPQSALTVRERLMPVLTGKITNPPDTDEGLFFEQQ